MRKAADWAVKNPFWVTALVCVVFYLLPFKPKPFGDGDYHYGTIQLIDFIANGFSGNVMVNKGFLTLFFYLPSYLLVYPFHSDSVYFASGVIFSCLLVCFAVRYLFLAFDIVNLSANAKKIVLLLLCLFPVHVYYAMGIIGEAFGFFAVSLLVYYWCRIVKSDHVSSKHMAIVALCLVMIYGFKPSMLPFVAVCAAYILILRIRWKQKFTFAAVFLLVPMLFFLEQKLDHSKLDFKEMVFRYQILWSRFELRDEPLNWMPQHTKDAFSSTDYLNNLAKRRELDSICEAQNLDKTSYYIQWVTNDILENPGLAARQYFLKFFQSQSFVISPLMKSDKPAAVKWGIHIYINAINFVLVVLALGGLVKLFREKRYRLVMPLFFFWGWCLMYICLFHSEQRYMFVFRAGLIFMAAYYINVLLQKRQQSIQ